YLGGNAITNGITDVSHQTPGSSLPDNAISLANSALFGSGGFSGQLADSLLFAPQASGDPSRFLYNGPPAPANLVSLTQEDLVNVAPVYLALIPQNQLANTEVGEVSENDVTLAARGNDVLRYTDRESRILNTGFIAAALNLILGTAQLRNEKRSADVGEIHQ